MTTVGTATDSWLHDAASIAAALGTDLDQGLAPEEAARRLATVGPNRLDTAAPIPTWRKIAAGFADPLVALLLVAVAISLVSWTIDGAHGVPFEAIVIALIVVANAVLGYVQEARAEQAVAALQRIAAPTSTVMRGGLEVRVPAREVVPGDVLVVREGDAVSADARLVHAAALTVTEAALTGESEPVLKDERVLSGAVPLAERVNMVFSGTAIARGTGRAVVVATGMQTELGRIAGLLEQTREAPTPLQREIAIVGRTLGIAVVIIAVVVVGAILLTSEIERAGDLVDVLLIGVSLAVAAVPEGLPAVLSVVLALGVQRMAREHAIVKQLASVETLGSASAICSDKTGTLTRSEMTIQRIVTRSGRAEVTGSGYRPEGRILVDGRPLEDRDLTNEIRIVLSGGSLTSDASLHEADGTWVAVGDPTEVAFLVAERKAGFAAERAGRFRRVGEVPFTSERRLMSTLQSDTEAGGIAVVTKGAPDVVLARCTHEQVGTTVHPLDQARREEILAIVDGLADEAFRTLAVAYRPLAAEAEPRVHVDLEHELIFAGVVGIIDPPRDEARDAIAEAHAAGVRVLMITGDHPRTARRIAAQLGVAPPDARTLSGAEIDALDADAFRDAVREVSVYARVAPEHKLRIIDALQADGVIVAMTGDGVNDAPALRSADIGVAMGITGTDVAKEAANLILTDDDFATIVTAVREGRAIFSNIRKFLRYLLSSNVGEVLTMFLGVVLAGVIGLDRSSGPVAAVPLLATQILWINLLTDTAPALAMGVDPPPDDLMTRPPRRLTDRVIDVEMWRDIVFVGVVMAIATLVTLDAALPGGVIAGSHGITTARTMAFTTLVLAQLFNCLNARSSRVSAFHRLFANPWLWAAIAVSAVLQVAVVSLPFLNEPFDTTALDAGQWLLCVVMASTVLWAVELRKAVRRAALRARA